ncbi:adenylate kinase family protein [Candidatus Bathyarchaeota archaeon]|nr:adenylate kinase family protein [Candidatus Bathyarchaeota archaeon]
MVTGTPGTGKTTFSRALSERLHARHIELSVYAKENGFILYEDSERDTAVVDMERLRTGLQSEMMTTRETVIIDGHYSHDLVDPGEAEAVFVLRRAPWVLAEVLRGRGYREEKVRENVEAEIIGVCAAEAMETYPPGQVCEIDTTDSTPDESVDKAMSRVSGEAVCDGPVDWAGHPKTLEMLKENVSDR